MQKIKDFFKKIVDKIDDKINAVPKLTILRISLSLFFTGILLVTLNILIIAKPSQDYLITSVAGLLMGTAIAFFPYFNIDKFAIGLLKVIGYFFYLLILLRYLIFYLENPLVNFNNLILTIILAILIFVWLNLTLKPIFSTIKFVSDKIKELGDQNEESNIITGFKKIFSALGIVTAFIISILTIVEGIIGFIK